MRSTSPGSASASGRRAPRAATSASASRCSTSAPATARRPSPRVAWTSRRATSGSRSPWTPPAIVEARIGASPHGQGLGRRSRQLIADELGLEPDADPRHPRRHRPDPLWLGHLRQPLDGDRGRRLQARGRDSSRTQAARHRGHLLQAEPADIVLADGAARVRGTDLGIAIAELARAAYHKSHRLRARRSTPASRRPPPTIRRGPISNACHVAIVEVDAETGGVRHRALPRRRGRRPPDQPDDRRRPGAAAASRRASRNALLEEIVYDESGNILTASLADFLPPTAREIPPIEILHLETMSDASITRAKGLGEGGDDRRAGGRPQRDLAMRSRRSASASSRCRRRRGASAMRSAERAGDSGMTANGRPRADRQRPGVRDPRSSRGARSPTRSARTAGSPARISAASTASAAPAPCSSTASRSAPA